ncbi:putative lipid II flippase FtsW [Lachnospiraceae bacterium NSJ-143]|nr:putative lipid II flippase FtsW [Lachnospiraceae bacterium NSJ-143]
MRTDNVRNIRSVKKHNDSRPKRKKKNQTVDFTLLFVIVLLILFGLVMVFSSSYYYTLTRAKFNNDMYYFVKRQAVWVVLGLIAMTFFVNFPYKFLRRFTLPLYVFTNICLVLVLIIGQDMNGSKRWLGVGPIGFQPSEVAKIAVIMYLSHYIVTHKGILNTTKGFLRCCMILALPVVLVAIENLSTAIVIAGIGGAILFVASPKIWYFVLAIAAGAGGGALAIMLPQFAYRFDRVKYWLNPFLDPSDKGYQIIQSLYAVASGGLFGLGLGQSRQKTYVPEPYNDIIFAIICEELGMVGAAIVIILFVVLIWRGIRIAMNSDDLYGCLVAVGIVALIGIQVIINIAVSTNSMPNTGMALPFISYGGSGLLFTLSSMGVLLNISKYQRTRR